MSLSDETRDLTDKREAVFHRLGEKLEWFDAHGKCRCGAKSDGILRGTRNESYGEHCNRCAQRRLAASKKVREQEREADSNG